jgi:hypothetical protein
MFVSVHAVKTKVEVQFHSFFRSTSDKMFGLMPHPVHFYAYCKAHMMGPIGILEIFGKEKQSVMLLLPRNVPRLLPLD